MKILVFGGTGVLGHYLVNELRNANHEVSFTYHSHSSNLAGGYKLDITNENSTVNLILHNKPDVVIHTVALPGVDQNECNKQLATSINVNGTKNILKGCVLINCKVVYVSTSHVFNGLQKFYTEDDLPSPISHYGVTKAKAEELVKSSKLDYLILRTDQPYGWIERWHRINSVIRVISTLKSNNILKEVKDWYNVPTYVPDFVDATKILLEKNEQGIFHLTGPDYINRYDWSLIVAEVFNLDKNLIHPISSESLQLSVKRANVNLSNKKIVQKTGIKMSGVKDGALKMIRASRDF